MNQFFVEDLFGTRNNTTILPSFILTLFHQCFSLKYLCFVHYFSMAIVLSIPSGLLLVQHKYIRDPLHFTNMTNVKGYTAPMSSTLSLTPISLSLSPVALYLLNAQYIGKLLVSLFAHLLPILTTPHPRPLTLFIVVIILFVIAHQPPLISCKLDHASSLYSF